MEMPRLRSGPVEGALFVEPGVANEKDSEEDKHRNKGEGTHVSEDPRAKKDGPGKEKNRLDVENNEKHGDDVKACRVTAASVAFRRYAALVRLELRGT